MFEFIAISVVTLGGIVVLIALWNWIAESYVYRKYWLHLPFASYMLLIDENRYMPNLAFSHSSFIFIHKQICKTIRDNYILFRPGVYSTNILRCQLHYGKCYISDIEKIPRNDDGIRNTDGYVSLIELDVANDNIKSTLTYIPEIITYDWNKLSNEESLRIKNEIEHNMEEKNSLNKNGKNLHLENKPIKIE